MRTRRRDSARRGVVAGCDLRLQGPRLLPAVRRPPDGRDRGVVGRPRAPARRDAAVGCHGALEAGGAPKTGRTGSVTATQRFGSDDEGGDHDDDDDAQAVIQQASLLGQAALGERAGKRARRVQVLGGKELPLPPRCANFAGYSLHAGVGFKASDRAGLERLCRYILRAPLAKGPSGKNVQHRGRPRAAAARREERACP